MTTVEKLPIVERKEDDIVITLPIDMLIFVVENQGNYPTMKVIDRDLFAKEFIEKLANHQTQNSQETGLTGLQEYFEVIVGEVAECGNSIELIEPKL